MEATISRLVEQYEQGKTTRRQLVKSLVAAVGSTAMARNAAAAAAESTFQATRLNHIALTVIDVARSRDFYTRHLGLQVTRDGSPSSCFLDCGPNFVALFRGQQAGMHHYCYSIADFDQREAAEKLRAQGIEPELQGRRIYFPDPDNLTVQLASESHGAAG